MSLVCVSLRSCRVGGDPGVVKRSRDLGPDDVGGSAHQSDACSHPEPRLCQTG